MMSTKILILSFGNESSIEIIKSLAPLNRFEIHGAHWDIHNPGKAYLNKKFIHQIANITDPLTFFADIKKLVDELDIEYIFVTNCKILKCIYDNYSIAHALPFLIPNRETLKYCLFKRELYQKLPQFSPKVYQKLPRGVRIEPDDNNRDFYIKPNFGSSGDGGRKASGALPLDIDTNDVVTEYLPGEEVTVDCLSDEDGNLQNFNVRIRESVRGGITNVGYSGSKDLQNEIGEILQSISRELKIPYLWFAQFKRNKDDIFKLLEINCRVSGSFAITRTQRKDFIKELMFHLVIGINFSRIDQNQNIEEFRVVRHFNVLEIGRPKYIFDIDGTILTETGGNYQDALPIWETIELINELYFSGAEIIIHSARGMIRFNNDVAKVYDNLFELTKKQLAQCCVYYDKLILGKPPGIYVDNDILSVEDLKKKMEKTKDATKENSNFYLD